MRAFISALLVHILPEVFYIIGNAIFYYIKKTTHDGMVVFPCFSMN